MSEEENSNSESQSTLPYRVTHASLQEKILSGCYKLQQRNGRSNVWNVFMRIEDNNGFIIPDKVCCRKCYSILTYNNRTSSNNLSRHKCFKKNMNLDVRKTLLTKTKDATHTNSPKIESNTSSDKSVSVDNQSSQERNQIKHNILTGVFKLRTKLSKCKVWHVFRFIEDNKGNKIPKKVCCKVCFQVLNFHEHTTSNLVKHKCYIKTKNTISFKKDFSKSHDIMHTESSNSLEKVNYPVDNASENLNTKKLPNANESYNEYLETVSYTELDEFPPTKEWAESYSIHQLDETPSNENVYSDLKGEVGKIFSEWCIENFRPFQLVKDNGLRRFAEFMIWIGANYGTSINIDCLLPDTTCISNSITKKYEETFKEVKNEIAEICQNGYGLTTKIWFDNCFQLSYMSLTIHYIKSGQLVTKLLGLSAMHNEEDINDIEVKIQETLNNYNCLCEDSIIVTDGSFNIVPASYKLNNISCINYILDNVIIESVKKVTELEKFYNLCSKLKEYFIQTNLDCKLGNIFNSLCPTKWNALYYLLNVIKENWLGIEEILLQHDKILEFEDINEQCIDEILNILKPFEHVSKKLENEEHPTIHLVYACINGLKGSCSAKSSDYNTIRQFKEILSEQLQTIVISNLSITHKIALFLFPPANKLIQFRENEKILIKTTIISLLKPYTQNVCEKVEKEPSTSSESSEMLTSYLKNFLAPLKNYNPCDQISNEIYAYECLTVPFEDNFNILQWWHNRQSQFPLLYKLSCKILATPATCASSEKVFSIVKQLAKSNINILSNTETLNELIFLNINAEKGTKFEECTFEELYSEKTRIENNDIEEV